MSNGLGLSIDVDGLTETLRAFRGLERDVRRQANSELRQAAGDCARGLVDALRVSAASSGVPVAARVAASVRVKSDRLPAVSIGGNRRVGRNGARAAVLVWGSEHGPKSEVNRFGVPPGPGYWIRPTVERFKSNEAIRLYRTQVAAIMRKYRLL